MKGNLFLSEAMDKNDIESGKMNIIQAPTGCGKSTYALDDNGLSTLASKKSKCLYVIDTKNGREQKLKHTNTAPCDYEWIRHMKNGPPEVVAGVWATFDDEKIVVITYAKFGVLVNKIPDFGSYFDVIICDELHGGIKMTTYGGKTSEEENHALRAVKRIKELVSNANIKIIALTATPTLVERHFKGLTKYITIHEDIRQYETYETISYTGLEYLVSTLKGKRGIVYHQRIRGMKMALDSALKAGMKAIAIWGTDNKNNPMSEEQLRVRQCLINEEKIPLEYDMLIINASCETGINIRGDLDYVVVHNTNEDIRTQVRGRYRGDLQTQYLLDGNADLFLPDEYIDRPLFKKEKDELWKMLTLRNENGNCVKFTTAKEKLREAGYIILEGDTYRKNNKRYCIILAP